MALDRGRALNQISDAIGSGDLIKLKVIATEKPEIFNNRQSRRAFAELAISLKQYEVIDYLYEGNTLDIQGFEKPLFERAVDEKNYRAVGDLIKKSTLLDPEEMSLYLDKALMVKSYALLSSMLLAYNNEEESTFYLKKLIYNAVDRLSSRNINNRIQKENIKCVKDLIGGFHWSVTNAELTRDLVLYGELFDISYERYTQLLTDKQLTQSLLTRNDTLHQSNRLTPADELKLGS